MSKRVLCKFFAHGACLKGDHCEFSHDWKASPNNICTFYQKGVCSYGSRCRYEHVKVSHSQPSVPSSSTSSHQLLVSDSASLTHPSRTVSNGLIPAPGVPLEPSASSRPLFPPTEPAWNQESGDQDFLENDIGEPRTDRPADQAICSFAAAGSCPRGEICPHIHGDLCPTCGKHCLHPFRPEEREEHLRTCQKKQKHLEALKHSQEIECSVCLDRVLSKATAAERKFGLLSECDHPFCISCIRNWRSSSPASGMDINTALRACPICRKLSYFVIPSVIWYSTKEEKQEIVDSYKAKLRSIDCKHFDFGNGTCPFGTSCFYKHAYRDGRLEEVVLRHLGAEDGHVMIAKNIRGYFQAFRLPWWLAYKVNSAVKSSSVPPDHLCHMAENSRFNQVHLCRMSTTMDYEGNVCYFTLDAKDLNCQCHSPVIFKNCLVEWNSNKD